MPLSDSKLKLLKDHVIQEIRRAGEKFSAMRKDGNNSVHADGFKAACIKRLLTVAEVQTSCNNSSSGGVIISEHFL